MKNKYFVWAFLALGVYSLGFGITISNWPSIALGVFLLLGVGIMKFRK